MTGVITPDICTCCKERPMRSGPRGFRYCERCDRAPEPKPDK